MTIGIGTIKITAIQSPTVKKTSIISPSSTRYLKTKNLPPKLNYNLNARQREGKAFVDKVGKDFAVEKDLSKIITNLFLCKM